MGGGGGGLNSEAKPQVRVVTPPPSFLEVGCKKGGEKQWGSTVSIVYNIIEGGYQ